MIDRVYHIWSRKLGASNIPEHWEPENRPLTADDITALLMYVPFFERNQDKEISDNKVEFDMTAISFINDMKKHAFIVGGGFGRLPDMEWSRWRSTEVISNLDLSGIRAALTQMWRCYVWATTGQPFLRTQDERIVGLQILRRLAII